MKRITNLYIALLVIVCMQMPSLTGWAQSNDYVGAKEKIYLHTNHIFFKPGEQVYFKLYLVDAKSQMPSQMSKVVYVEVIDPAGNVIQKLNYQAEHGYAEGSWDFDAQAKGGVYQLRAYTTWMRNEQPGTFMTKEITLQKVIAPRVLMKLDFPGKGYGAGDEVMADFSMRNLLDQPIRDYDGTFKVSLGGEVISTAGFKTNSEGKSKIRFRLPNNLNTNDGLLNITVQYDSYTESISRSIPIVLNKIDLQFMPEGGSLVEGIPTVIAFKALNEYGKAADVKGEVLDNAGRRVAVFESYHFGMGKFDLKPEKGISYKAVITSPANIRQQFALPAASASGVVMNVSRADKQVMVALKASGQATVKLIGQSREVIYYSKELVLQKGDNRVAVDANLFPAGIARFTAYAAGEVPLVERILFLHENRNLKVSLTTDKKKYLPREKVRMSLQTLDENDQPVPSNFSLSVVDDKLWSFADDKQDHILSWLLMSSELKGKVEEPTFYFKKEEPRAIPALDLVMLTHGYRYFDFIEYVQKEGKLQFYFDQGNILSGLTFNGKGEPVEADVYLVNAANQRNAIHFKTGADGVFYFSQLTAGMDYYLLAQARHKKEKVVIKVLQNGIGYNPLQPRKKTLPAVDDKYVATVLRENGLEAVAQKDKILPLKEGKQNNPVGMFNGFMANAQLNDVVVVGYGTARKLDITGSITQVRANDLSAPLQQALQGRVAGLSIVNNGNPLDKAAITIRGLRSLAGTNDPLIVIDGTPVEQFRLHGINPNDIESVTILKDAAATTLYGARAANGVIVIETKKNGIEKIRFDLTARYYYTTQTLRATGMSYSVARRFYAPRYQSTEVSEKTDFRETIYWNPVVQTDKQGKAVIEFYNSDASTTFRAIAEGIGYNGKAGRTETTYAAQDALTVDAKIPPYLTVGDKAFIPLVIKNNSLQELRIAILLELPANLKAGNYTPELLLAPDSSQQVLVPVEAIKPVNGTIGFSITGGSQPVKLSLPIVASEKGFPVIATFAGNRSAKHDFNIHKAIPGSVHAELKLFKTLEGQLLDGIASMLREPGGCFEQTSSTLYPNIYILKFLKSSGKSNPEVEKKAVGYIKNGYKRLLGFETAQHGFEWFGKTPPHEALTAYGLLEFTDMAEFIDVDKAMLKRTKDFLLGRRDGNGGFKLASGGYDQFASVPNKVANIYIVYAFTEAGMGHEIRQEYDAAVKAALETKDGYQLSMMALAASNMNNDKDYMQLMSVANEYYKKTTLSSETSVVSSRGISLQIETQALYALALMRGSKPDVPAVTAIISKLMGNKTYYGYGSTQATVLALKAIVGYSKLVNNITEDTPVTFTINDQKARSSSDVDAGVREGENNFAVTYSNRSQAIPYSLEVSYNTFTPPNSEKAPLRLATRLKSANPSVGETVRMEIEVTNEQNILQPMAIAKCGIPAGLSVQPWQLKEIMEKNQAAYYELFDNWLVFYWMGMAPGETKKINLDLKAEIPGTYKAKASNVYLYYTPEDKHWNDGVEITIRP